MPDNDQEATRPLMTLEELEACLADDPKETLRVPPPSLRERLQAAQKHNLRERETKEVPVIPPEPPAEQR